MTGAGRVPADPRRGAAGEWEQRSDKLRVSPIYYDRLATFASYFEREMESLGADRTRIDLVVLRKLADYEGVAGAKETAAA